ncbi:MAG: choice-of-anchor D domain-containing protein [bacterium]
MRYSRYFIYLLFVISTYSTETYAAGVKAIFSPSARNFPGFGSVTTGKSKDQTLTISNQPDSISNGPLTVTITAPTGTVYSIVGPLTFTLNPGQSQALTIHFAPTATGLQRDTFYISHNADTSNNLKNPARYALSGTGVAPSTTPKISVTPGNTNFGSVVKGKSLTRTFTIKNVSDTARTLTGNVGLPLTKRYVVTAGAGAFTLDSGKSITVSVDFVPDTIAAFLIDTILITSNADAASNKINFLMTGAGIQPDTTPKITLSIGGGGFGAFMNVGSVAAKKTISASFTIKNTSDTIRVLSGAVGSTFTTKFSVSAGDGAFTLDTGKTVTVTINFTPDTVKQFTDSLIITSNSASPNNRIKVTLFGTGIKPDTFPQISISGLQQGGLRFGTDTIPKTRTLTFTMKNISDSLRKLIGNVGNPLNTSSPFSIVSGGGGFNIDSGLTKQVSVLFTPTSAGLWRDTIVVTTNSDGANQTIRIPLSGTGYVLSGPHIGVTPSTLNFGNPKQGAMNPSLTATVKNLADSAADILSGVVSIPTTPAFSVIAGNGNFTLNPHDSIHVTVQMSTANVGTFQDSVVINSNSNDVAKHFLIRLSGIVASVGGVEPGNPTITAMMAVPNPFSHRTQIAFSLSEQTNVSIHIYDVLGKEVFASAAQVYPSGTNPINWDATGLPDGSYQCVVNIGKNTQSLKLMLSK